MGKLGSQMAGEKLLFIGGGQMAQALAAGALDADVLAAHELGFVEPVREQVAVLHEKFPACTVYDSPADGLRQADLIILSVKPHVLKDIAETLSKCIQPQHLIVSIAAGVSLQSLQTLMKTQRVVRVMPNTPAMVGAGAAAISHDSHVAEQDLARVEALLRGVGSVVRVPDHLMHAVTALSGSGPAYVYMMIEALSDGGVATGLPRDIATRLAAQTVLGAAQMVLESGRHPGVLKDQVTSPGGTTIAAIRSLELAGVRGAFIDAVVAADKRSREL